MILALPSKDSPNLREAFADLMCFLKMSVIEHPALCRKVAEGIEISTRYKAWVRRY